MDHLDIVYVTRLSKNKWAGPNTSVPKQIEAQSKIDNVFWYNVNDLIIGKKAGNIECHCINEYPSLRIKDLPKPFNNPDLVIFEGFYHVPFLKIAASCRKDKIPYIIIPRSSLTDAGQRSKYLKKQIGNTMFFNKFAKRALAIQYLTEKERNDSGDHWNDISLIIPNGICGKNNVKTSFNSNKITGVFIGRLDIYQKGLDIFIEACARLKDELDKYNCKINIYGPDIDGSKGKLEESIITSQLQNVVYINDGIFDDEKEKKQLESDFFILTSRFEGHPMGLIEALSYGLPCIVTTGSNMADEIREADAGWTADTDVNSITKALKTMLSEKGKLSMKSKNALALSQEYNWDKLAMASHEKYKNLLKGEYENASVRTDSL